MAKRWIGSVMCALLVAGCAGGDGGEDAGDGDGGVVVEQTVVITDVDDVIVEADRILFPRATHADVLGRKPGEFLVGDRANADLVAQKNPDGFLRRIVSVGEAGDYIVVETELAFISDIIAEGTFTETIEPVQLGDLPPVPVPLRLDPGSSLTAEPGSPAAKGLVQEFPLALTVPDRLRSLGAINFSGLKYGPVSLKSPPIKKKIKGVDTNIQLTATLLLTLAKGTFSFNPGADLFMDIGLWDGLREFRFALVGELISDIGTNISVTVALNAGVDMGKATPAEKEAINQELENWALNNGGFPLFDEKISSASVNLPTWWLPTVPPVPVVSTLGFDLRLACSVGRVAGTATATASTKGSATLAVGARWQKDAGWSPVAERTHDVTAEDQSLTGALSVTAGCTLKPRLELIFYGMAGPNVYLNATGQAELKAAQSCPGQQGTPKVDVTLKLIRKLTAGVGARLGIIAGGFDLTIAEANLDLFGIDWSTGDDPLWSGYPELFGGFGFCSENVDFCGDAACNGEETCETCEEDCGVCAACGDGMCTPGEDCSGCEEDCGVCPLDCGDGVCDGEETCWSCPADCGACPGYCGDHQCNGEETCDSCSADCGICPAQCGDGQCNGAETCGSCEADCGSCPPSCGDAMCDNGENCWSCPADCGACQAECGDGQCNGDETCDSCEADCGACPDPCGNGGEGDGWYCGKTIGGISTVLYSCTGGQTDNTINCGYGCAGCFGKGDVCDDYNGQTDEEACSDGPVCDYNDQDVCGGSNGLWCYQGQCKQCTGGFANCDGTQGCECDGYCGVGDVCCKPDDCNADCPLC